MNTARRAAKRGEASLTSCGISCPFDAAATGTYVSVRLFAVAPEFGFGCPVEPPPSYYTSLGCFHGGTVSLIRLLDGRVRGCR